MLLNFIGFKMNLFRISDTKEKHPSSRSSLLVYNDHRCLFEHHSTAERANPLH